VDDRGSRGRRFQQGQQTDAFAQAAEFVITPLLFGLLGWFLDSQFGTGRFFMVALAVVAFVGIGVANYYRYMHHVTRADEGKPWTRRKR
jgi:F0F1-type ATP synthase assembly protein I